MSQAERDRLVTLRKAQKRLITQAEAATELGVSVRHVKRLLKALKRRGDKAVIHGLRGRPSPHRLPEATKQEAMRILCEPVYAGFGPTLAAEYLHEKHGLKVSKETVRHWMREAQLWRGRPRKPEQVHVRRPRRTRCGELVQWDTSDHDWLEGRGERLYLISMIDDATSRLYARFVTGDSTAENMRVLWGYLERYGRPLAFYTDQAALFQTAQKHRRDEPGVEKDPVDLPPTQIGRALQELHIVWIAAHSPQAKGRVERGFSTAQDRLVKGLRVAGAGSLTQANAYLEQQFLPWWNRTLTVAAKNDCDAHRLLTQEHELPSILSHVDERQISNGYTVQYRGQTYQIPPNQVRTGMRGSKLRVEARLDGTMAMRFDNQYLSVAICEPPQRAIEPKPGVKPRRASPQTNRWMEGFFDKPALPLGRAIAIANATS
ncbi:MAG: ISNCY family transposase [Chloroflexi bacterium]|nr:ISNCY family transposase [Chloroflexota bacterium]